ncbi:hypothetical protein [Vreelandella sp. H-I2]
MPRINRSNAVLMLAASICGSPFIGEALAQEVYFSPNQIMTWPTRSFEGETRYAIVEKSGRPVLEAKSQGQASAR